MTLPSGTVTFLFTDIEGSTKLSQTYRDQWEALRARHHSILHHAIQMHSGHVFQIVGDEFCAAFFTAVDAVRAAADAQRMLFAETWNPASIKVRMGIHSGTARLSEADDQLGGYTGYIVLARTARLMSASHGGQVLVSLATEELVRDELSDELSLRDMGARRLKDLNRPEQIFQLIIPDLPTDFPPLKTLDAYRHNLPVQLTSFIGREKEMEQVVQSIGAHRLVTLTGVGGTGKSRLALQVAANLAEQFNDGVWLVELAAVSGPELIPQTILAAFGILEQQGRTNLQVVTDYVRERNILLVMDNCEHLIQACATLADHLLNNSHALKILATSREALNVKGEATWHVPSLSLPDTKQLPALEHLTQYEAVQLFIERALLVQPNFTVTNDNAPFVAQICSRLDGIPLAIELAAARVRAMSVDQITKRIDDRFRLLTGGSRTSLERHQTLRAAIDWSYNLLTEEEKRLLRSLAVFSGGWTLDAAESACSQGGSGFDILDSLTQLVDKSLVNLEDSRYRMLETIRQYAREKMLDSDESERVRDAHLNYFVNLAEQSHIKTIAGDPQVLEALEAEHDNLCAALEHAIECSSEQAVRLGTALEYFWEYRGYYREEYAWAMRLLICTENEGTTKWRGRALGLAGSSADNIGEYKQARDFTQKSLEIARVLNDKYQVAYMNLLSAIMFSRIGEFDRAEPYNRESLEQFQELGIQWGIGTTLFHQGHLASQSGDIELARRSYEQSLQMARRENSKKGMATVLNSLGELARLTGDYALSSKFYEESRQLHQEMGNNLAVAMILGNLGEVALHEKDCVRAKNLFNQTLDITRQLENPRILLGCLDGFAGVAAYAGKYEQAALLFGAAQGSYEESGTVRDPADEMEYALIISSVREHLDPATFDSAWAEGKKLSVNAALELALKIVEDIK